MTIADQFLGRWRITGMEVWNQDYVDFVVPGHITFEEPAESSFQFGTMKGHMDCRYTQHGESQVVEFSWEGFNDKDQACGRGWAMINDDGTLTGRIFIHLSDDSAFTAVRSESAR